MPIGKKKMTPNEIRLLMRLKGWSQAELARQLDVTEGAITRWLNRENPITGPARVLMLGWLVQAKSESAKQPA